MDARNEIGVANFNPYIVNREPEKYGGKQEDYVERVREIVASTVQSFNEAKGQGWDFEQLFHDTLAALAAERVQLAEDHGTRKAELYGLRRDIEEEKSPIASHVPFSFTPLGHAYIEYNRQLLLKLQAVLKTMNHSQREFIQKQKKIEEGGALGRAFSSEYNIFSVENQAEWAAWPTYETYLKICEHCEVSPVEESHFSLEVFNELISDRNKVMLRKLKGKDISLYKKVKLTLAIFEIRNSFNEWKKSDWLMVTQRLEVDGKMYTISEHLTWMYRDFVEDPVDHMTGKSVVSLVHQDIFLIEPMLQDMAKIFKEAMQWDGKELKSLKGRVALLEYEFAHAMPFYRGSAAISEWLESAIYAFHGYQLSYAPDKMVNLEALTSSIKGFSENYDKMIQLYPLPS